MNIDSIVFLIYVSAQTSCKRLTTFLSEMYGRHPGQIVAAVTHGGIITDFLRGTFDTDTLVMLHSSFADGSNPDICNCSVTTVQITSDGIHVKTFAVANHIN